jgi:hypothetical protein
MSIMANVIQFPASIVTGFCVIEGGRAPQSVSSWASTTGKPSNSDDRRLTSRVRRAEKDVRTIADLIAPAIAMVGKPHAEIVGMVAASGWSDSVATRAAFRRAIRTARELADLIEDAEARLSAVITAMLRRALDEEKPDGQED